MTDPTYFPDLQDYYVNSSPYTEFPANKQNKNHLYDVIYTMDSIDCYCPKCKSNSVFVPDDNRPQGRDGHNRPMKPISDGSRWRVDLETYTAIIDRSFRCSRDNNHIMYFFSIIENSTIQKIGQYPSLATVNSFDIKKFRKILGEDYYKEFNRAIGLHAHGVGVGSFVYLRRIIENFIIQPAYEKAKGGAKWDDSLYQKSRVREKVKILKKHLPEFLVENSVIYSVISKGIHELTEEECNQYFPILKTCLELVLTEIEEKRKLEEKKTELAAKLKNIAQGE